MAIKKNKAMSMEMEGPDKWRAQEDASTLARAAEITADQTRHAAARTHAENQYQAVKSIKPKKVMPDPKAAAKPGKPKTLKKVK